jgi:hypothetical protein
MCSVPSDMNPDGLIGSCVGAVRDKVILGPRASMSALRMT